MSSKVVGLERKTGEYNGRAYDNTNVYCTYEGEAINGVGVASYKIKTALFNQQPCKVGDSVEILYDRFRNASRIIKI